MRVCPKCHSLYSDDGAKRCGIDGEALTTTQDDPFLGETIGGRYRITKLLGYGGMGRVYRAQDAGGMMVAIKVLLGDIAANEKLARRFTREAELAVRLHHRNIVRVMAAGTTDAGVQYMLMELLEGRSLEAIVREDGVLPPPRVAMLTRQIAAGLGCVHGRGIIHRDLKSANIMVVLEDELEVPKLLDFGLARIHDSGAAPGESPTRLTKTGHAMGTPHYMAPEQLRGEETTPRTDLYALGVVLYEMLAGAPPFQGTNDQILYRHAVEPPPQLPPARGLAAIAMRLLEKRPADRYASTDVVIAALDALQLYALRSGPTPDVGTAVLTEPTVIVRRDDATVVRPPPIAHAKIPRWTYGAVGVIVLLVGALVWASGVFDATTVVTLSPIPEHAADEVPIVISAPPASELPVPRVASTTLAVTVEVIAPVVPDHPLPRVRKSPRLTVPRPSFVPRVVPPTPITNAPIVPPPSALVVAEQPKPVPVPEITAAALMQRIRKIPIALARASLLDPKVKAGIERAYFDLDRDIRAAASPAEYPALLHRIIGLESTLARETKTH